MNERQFLREIKGKTNESGSFTPVILREFLESQKSLESPRKQKLFSKIFEKLGLSKEPKTIAQIVEDNLSTILQRTNDDQLIILCPMFFDNEELNDVAKNHFLDFLHRFDNLENDFGQRKMFLRDFRKMPSAPKVIEENMNKMLESELSFFDIQVLKGISPEADEKLNTYLEQNKKRMTKELIYSSLGFNKDFSYDEQEKMAEESSDTVSIIIDELLESEGKKMIDIDQKGSGGFCHVFQIGDKILKLGKPRETYEIPNHSKILQPIARTNLTSKDNKAFACLEVTEFVDKLDEKDLTLDKLFEVYNNLRDEGIIWTDAKLSNLGKLRKSNVPRLHGEEMYVAPSSVGFSDKLQGEIAQEGEIVILDTDFIYFENDRKINWPNESHSLQFEHKWQMQKKAKEQKVQKVNEEIKSKNDDKGWER